MSRGLWSVLKERDFRLVWFASAFSDLGTWMQIGALGIFITESTGQARWTGIASTITYLTAGLFIPIGGVLADRFDRRHLAIAAGTAQFTVGLVLVACFASGKHSPLLLISIAGIQGIASSIVIPALSAMVPDLVSKERSAHASLLEAVSWNVGRALGPIVAVFVVRAQSYSVVFLLNALSFATVAISLFFVRARPPRHHEDGSLTERLHSGWKGLRHNNICLLTTIIAAVEISLIAPFIALIPVMSQLTLHNSSSGSGMLFLGQGIGSALGVILIGLLMHRFGVGRLFLWMMTILPVLLIIYACSPNLMFAIIVIVPLSGAHSVVLALAISFIQQFASDNVRGRVMGIHRAITITSYAVASSTLAVLANEIGLRTTFIAIAMSTIVFMTTIAITQRSNLHALAAVDNAKQRPTELDPLSEEFIPDTQ